MKNKKIGVALLLAFMMIFQSFAATLVFAEGETATNVALDSAELDFLTALEVVPTTTYYTDDVMTRGHFAYIAAKLSGWNGEDRGESPFVDIADDHAYIDAITYLYDINIVQGTGNFRFNPDSPITLIDATSIMIKILGYGAIAPAKYGEYPLSHFRMGSQLEFYMGFATPQLNDGLTNEQAICLIANAAKAPMAVAESFGESTEYSFKEKNTILYVYRDIVAAEGIVTDDSMTAINGTTTLKPGGAIISGVKLNPSTNGFDAKGLLGMYVDYYYVEDTNEFVYACVQEEVGDVITIAHDDLLINDPAFSITNIVYYNANDKVKNAQIAANVDLVYNNAAYPAFSADDLKIESGYMTLIDRDSDKVYDSINITEYDDVVLKNTDVSGEVLYVEGRTIKLEEYTQYSIIDLNGNPVTLDGIAQDTLLSLVAAKDKSSITAIVCTKNEVSGAVTKGEIDEAIYYINDVGYELSNGFFKGQAANLSDTKNPEIGTSYKFLRNADGKVARAVELSSDNWYTGYCIGVGPEGAGLGAIAKMRTMTPQGGLLDLFFADKVKVNDRSGVTNSKLMTDADLFATSTSGDLYPIRQPVKYQIDTWGKITAIKTPVDISSDKTNYPYGFDLDRFSKDVVNAGTTFKADNVRAINGSYFVSANTLIISDPYLNDPINDAYESEEVQIIPYNSLGHGTHGSSVLYEVDEGFGVGMVVFSASMDVTNVNFNDYDNRTAALFVVDKVMRKLNEEGDAVKVIAGVSNNIYVEYPEAEEGVIPDDIKFGDVCTYKVVDNELVGIKVLMALDDPAIYPSYPDAAYIDERDGNIYDNIWSTQFGPIYSVSGTTSFVLQLPYRFLSNGQAGNDKVEFEINPLFGYSTNSGNTRVIVLDRAKDTVRAGTIKDIYTNVTPASNGEATIDDSTPRAFVYRRYSYASVMVIVK